MRLWSIHPKYLDAKGLVALWREGLLAKKVLEGKTKGYTRHPQLLRFKQCQSPLEAINLYLKVVLQEATTRGYNFDKSKLQIPAEKDLTLPVTTGQLQYELQHLKAKLQKRDPPGWEKIRPLSRADTHPVFYPVEGDVEEWEVIV